MSGNKQKIIYWDANVYLAWLKGEEIHGRTYLDAIRETAKENFEKKVVIITSTITLVEVLQAKLSEEQERLFRKSFKYQDHIARDVDPPVAIMARNFRQSLYAKNERKTVTTPDAIHLATASIYDAEFWTFDNGGSNKRSLGLLELSENDEVGKLKICKPWIPQTDLPLLN